MHGFVQNLGRTALNFFAALGRITLFSIMAIRWIFTPPIIGSNCFDNSLILGIIPCRLLVDHAVFRHGSGPSILHRFRPVFS